MNKPATNGKFNWLSKSALQKDTRQDSFQSTLVSNFHDRITFL